MSQSTKPGDTVRAVVAFPVTVGNQVAIPAGTFVEGQLISARAAGTKAKKGTSGRPLQIHFTKLVYANGYTVPLDARDAEASVMSAASGAADAAVQMPVGLHERGPDGGAAFIEGQVGEPFPPTRISPLPAVGPNPAVVIGGALGGLALVGLISLLVVKRHVKSTDAVLYNAGWQFSMALTSALRLDGAQVMDAGEDGSCAVECGACGGATRSSANLDDAGGDGGEAVELEWVMAGNDEARVGGQLLHTVLRAQVGLGVERRGDGDVFFEILVKIHVVAGQDDGAGGGVDCDELRRIGVLAAGVADDAGKNLLGVAVQQAHAALRV